MIALEGNGQRYDCELDLAKICEYERQHPDWSLMDVMTGMSSRMRLSDLDLLASFVKGFEDLDGWLDSGLSIEDLADVYQNSKYLGFTGSSQGTATE